MRAKKKDLPIMEKVSITEAAAEGKAVARVENMVVFVDNAVPGDVADLQVTRKKSNYREARAGLQSFRGLRRMQMAEHEV